MATIIRATGGVSGVPMGFPILVDDAIRIVEPAFAYLIDLAVIPGHSHATETVRTYAEHLHDWFDSLEQSGLNWREADERTIATYRNRMLVTFNDKWRAFSMAVWRGLHRQGVLTAS